MHKDILPMAASLVDRCTFMDDFAAGAEDTNGVITIYYELTTFMRQISLPMGKWASISETLKNTWRVGGLENKSTTQVLGVSSDTVRDTMFAAHRDATPRRRRGQKRRDSMFKQPRNSTTPWVSCSTVLITGKLIFQDSWCRGVEWDELLPDDLGTCWRNWITLLPRLATSTIQDGQEPGKLLSNPRILRSFRESI